MRLWPELRTRWRAALSLALLVGVTGGVVMAASAVARRTHTAYARLVTAQPAWDVTVAHDQSFGVDPGQALLAGQLGVVSEPVAPLPPVLLIIPATLLVANLVAAVPGWLAGRIQPAVALRAE